MYCHSNFESGNRPDYGWLKKIYRLFARKYKKNMKRLFIVHPDTWLKFFFFLAKLVRLAFCSLSLSLSLSSFLFLLRRRSFPRVRVFVLSRVSSRLLRRAQPEAGALDSPPPLLSTSST